MFNIDTLDFETLETVLAWDLPEEALTDAVNHFMHQQDDTYDFDRPH